MHFTSLPIGGESGESFFSQSQQTQTIRGENDYIYLTQRARKIVRGGYHWILPYLDLIGREGSTRFFNRL